MCEACRLSSGVRGPGSEVGDGGCAGGRGALVLRVGRRVGLQQVAGREQMLLAKGTDFEA